MHDRMTTHKRSNKRSAFTFDALLCIIVILIGFSPSLRGAFAQWKTDVQDCSASYLEHVPGIKETTARINERATDKMGHGVLLNERGLIYHSHAERNAQNAPMLLVRCAYMLAIDDFRSAAIVDPSFADALLNLANACPRLGDWDCAVQSLGKLVNLDPDNAEKWNMRGVFYMLADEHKKAIEDFDMSISLQPDLAEAFYNRSIAYEAMGDVANALKALQQAISLKVDEKYWSEELTQLKNTRNDNEKSTRVGGEMELAVMETVSAEATSVGVLVRLHRMSGLARRR